ncbi:DUF1510 family protein [Bacillus solitudinis]|uniref:DUF1510 family protein n=1 Tax=Bacillus solitudinis TaxID=2014074 RepID=UPI000C24FE45|nr:DUF1510 family protein [Bacillus solitudinis]
MGGTRFEYRKSKRLNRFLNTAIGIVVVLIGFFAVQIFFGSTESEEVAVVPEEENIESENTENENSISDEVGSSPTEETPVQDEDVEQGEDELNEDETENGLEPVEDGQWQPVGTSQTGEFTPDFTENSVNWNEMTRALQYATGLSEDDMIIFWLGNGGSATSAVGTVSAKNQQDQPYQVRLEWVDGQGWLPVEKKQLESNPYR